MNRSLCVRLVSIGEGLERGVNITLSFATIQQEYATEGEPYIAGIKHPFLAQFFNSTFSLYKHMTLVPRQCVQFLLGSWIPHVLPTDTLPPPFTFPHRQRLGTLTSPTICDVNLVSILFIDPISIIIHISGNVFIHFLFMYSLIINFALQMITTSKITTS